jgi:hypothetical protein
MGSFSFFCKKSKKNIQDREAVYLFLLKDGVVLETQYGDYNTYGNVVGHEWKMPWNDVCKLMWKTDKGNGIAAIRAEVYNGEIPTTRSDEDPNQGTGRRKVIKTTNSYHTVLTINEN